MLFGRVRCVCVCVSLNKKVFRRNATVIDARHALNVCPSTRYCVCFRLPLPHSVQLRDGRRSVHHATCVPHVDVLAGECASLLCAFRVVPEETIVTRCSLAPLCLLPPPVSLRTVEFPSACTVNATKTAAAPVSWLWSLLLCLVFTRTVYSSCSRPSLRS